MNIWSRLKGGFAGLAILAFTAGVAGADALDPLAECGEDCRPVGALLSVADAEELARLPAELRATLAEIADRTTTESDIDAQALAMRLTRGTFDGEFDRVKTGRRPCTVYWYGFLDEGSRRVGRHQCRIERKDGRLTVTKVTGDGLAATLYPYGAVRAFVGRTYLEDHKQRSYDRDTPKNAENENYGNKVGVALADGGRLYVVSTNENGFTEPDPTFFEIIAVE